MYDVMTRASFVERATALQWNFTGDALRILHWVQGDADAFEAAIAEIPEVIDYDLELLELDIEVVNGLSSAPPVARGRLSDRQREAIDAAIELGYDEIPREASHEDVADALDCAPSTAAEHLQKAESKLVETARQRP